MSEVAPSCSSLPDEHPSRADGNRSQRGSLLAVGRSPLTAILHAMMTFRFVAAALLTAVTTSSALAQSYPPPAEGSFIARNYKFESGDTMAEVKLHYWTVG